MQATIKTYRVMLPSGHVYRTYRDLLSAADYATASASGTCQCTDPGCPHCQGECAADASTTLYRIDMQDTTGAAFCDACASDALDSGVFAPDDGTECPECGEELDKDCVGNMRCPECDGPCPCCDDGGGPGAADE